MTLFQIQVYRLPLYSRRESRRWKWKESQSRMGEVIRINLNENKSSKRTYLYSYTFRNICRSKHKANKQNFWESWSRERGKNGATSLPIHQLWGGHKGTKRAWSHLSPFEYIPRQRETPEHNQLQHSAPFLLGDTGEIWKDVEFYHSEFSVCQPPSTIWGPLGLM